MVVLIKLMDRENFLFEFFANYLEIVPLYADSQAKKTEMGIIYYHVARIHGKIGDEEGLLNYLNEAKRCFEVGNIEIIEYGLVLEQLGLFYFQKGRPQTALNHFQDAVCIFEQVLAWENHVKCRARKILSLLILDEILEARKEYKKLVKKISLIKDQPLPTSLKLSINVLETLSRFKNQEEISRETWENILTNFKDIQEITPRFKKKVFIVILIHALMKQDEILALQARSILPMIKKEFSEQSLKFLDLILVKYHSMLFKSPEERFDIFSNLVDEDVELIIEHEPFLAWALVMLKARDMLMVQGITSVKNVIDDLSWCSYFMKDQGYEKNGFLTDVLKSILLAINGNNFAALKILSDLETATSVTILTRLRQHLLRARTKINQEIVRGLGETTRKKILDELIRDFDEYIKMAII